MDLPPPDLGPTASLTQTLQLLRDVLACHDASVVPVDDKKQDYKQVCSMIYVREIECEMILLWLLMVFEEPLLGNNNAVSRVKAFCVSLG